MDGAGESPPVDRSLLTSRRLPLRERRPAHHASSTVSRDVASPSDPAYLVHLFSRLLLLLLVTLLPPPSSHLPRTRLAPPLMIFQRLVERTTALRPLCLILPRLSAYRRTARIAARQLWLSRLLLGSDSTRSLPRHTYVHVVRILQRSRLGHRLLRVPLQRPARSITPFTSPPPPRARWTRSPATRLVQSPMTSCCPLGEDMDGGGDARQNVLTAAR
ncbi:hypothetical protein C8Q79DRAFT_188197 [Trametes meyenii]|nr:hypothetical protein C8Q79DRAFT_188197 [Trametes meyenii]